MIAKTNEHEKMLQEIMQFTSSVVCITEMPGVSNRNKADAIFMCEKIFHKVIMDKLVSKCVEKSIPCNN